MTSIDHPAPIARYRYEIETGPAHHSGERPWMLLASTITVEAKTVGSRCVYLAVTTDQDALEAALEADDDVTTYNVVTYRIQIDEETGADEVWDALHDYADAHPAPACLAQFVARDSGWTDDREVCRMDAKLAESWLAQCAEACNWDERTTPILVISTEG